MSLYYDYPEFDQALNALWMSQALESEIRRVFPSISIESCVIADVKYKPGKPCILLYKTSLKDLRDGRKWKQLFSVQLLSSLEEPARFSHCRSFFIDSPKCVVFLYPHDPVLTWLPQFYEKALLNQMQQEFSLGEDQLLSIEPSLLAYTPQMRATLQMEVTVKKQGNETPDKKVWICKTNVHKKPEKTFPNYLALWNAGKEEVPMPRPVGCLLSPPATFQEKVIGVALGSVVQRSDFEALIKRVGYALARFHRLDVSLTSSRTLADEKRNLNRWSEMLISLCPEWETRIESLRLKILSEWERRFLCRAPIHADFHHTNVLVDQDNFVLIDMDEAAYGDSCLDVGRFMSSLRIPALRVFGSFEGLEEARGIFLETYLANAQAPLENIRLYESASLLTSAASCFRFQRHQWKQEAEMLLEEAEKVLIQARPIQKKERLVWKR